MIMWWGVFDVNGVRDGGEFEGKPSKDDALVSGLDVINILTAGFYTTRVFIRPKCTVATQHLGGRLAVSCHSGKWRRRRINSHA